MFVNSKRIGVLSMKKRWNITILITLSLLLSLVAACGTSDEGEDTTHQENETDNLPDEGFPVTINNADRDITFDAPPERVVALYQQEAELMAALDLEDKLVGYSIVSDNTPEEYEEKLEDIPILGENSYPSKEVLLEAEPDFAIGSERTFMDNGVGTVEELERLGITAYVTESEKPETIENMVYKQIKETARIFGVEDRGEQLIQKMNEEIDELVEGVGVVDEPLKVFYMSGADAGSVQTTGGISLDNYLIELAGGENIFKDEEEYLFEVSWEEVIDRNPDVILMSYCCGTKPEDLEGAVENNDALKDITAVKNSNYIAVQVEDMTGNVRVIQGLETLIKGFYPDQIK